MENIKDKFEPNEQFLNRSMDVLKNQNRVIKDMIKFGILPGQSVLDRDQLKSMKPDLVKKIKEFLETKPSEIDYYMFLYGQRETI